MSDKPVTDIERWQPAFCMGLTFKADWCISINGEVRLAIVRAKRVKWGKKYPADEQRALAHRLAKLPQLERGAPTTTRPVDWPVHWPSDDHLLEAAVRSHIAHGRPSRPRWATIADTGMGGSTVAAALCLRFGLDPDKPSGPDALTETWSTT